MRPAKFLALLLVGAIATAAGGAWLGAGVSPVSREAGEPQEPAAGAVGSWRVCPGCGRIAWGGLRFCPFDGRVLAPGETVGATARCPRCNRSLPGGLRFCPFDGAPLATGSAPDAADPVYRATIPDGHAFPLTSAVIQVREALERARREGRTVWIADPARLPELHLLLQALSRRYMVDVFVRFGGGEASREHAQRVASLIETLDLPPIRRVVLQNEKDASPRTDGVVLRVEAAEKDRLRVVLEQGFPWFARSRHRPALLFEGEVERGSFAAARRFAQWYRDELERVRLPETASQGGEWETVERCLLYLWANPWFDSLESRTVDDFVRRFLGVSGLALFWGIPAAALPTVDETVALFPLGFQVLQLDVEGRLPAELIARRDGVELVRVHGAEKLVYMDRWETSASRYARFLLLRPVPLPLSFDPESGLQTLDDRPVVNVSWYEAVSYLQWAGRRLPSAREWQLAARHTVQLDPPGNTKHCSVFHPFDISNSGCVNLSSGVDEWLSDGAPGRNRDNVERDVRLIVARDAVGDVARFRLLPATTRKHNLGFRGVLVVDLSGEKRSRPLRATHGSRTRHPGPAAGH